MKKINLKSKELEVGSRKKVSGLSSLFLGLLFLFVSSGIYGGILYLKNKESDKIDSTEREISQKKDQLDSEEFRELYAFQSRLFELEEVLELKESFADHLTNLETFTIAGSYFKKVGISLGDGYVMFDSDLISPDYLSLSRQIEAYTEIGGAEKVVLEDSKNSEEGLDSRISFQMKRLNYKEPETKK